VQGGESSYSSPREEFENLDEYDKFECGYPRPTDEPLLKKFKDVGQIFGYVPAAVVLQIIAKHGGIQEFI